MALSAYPATMRVITAGYENGFDDVPGVKPMRIAIDVNSEWYYGPHATADGYQHHNKCPGAPVEEALLIGHEEHT